MLKIVRGCWRTQTLSISIPCVSLPQIWQMWVKWAIANVIFGVLKMSTTFMSDRIQIVLLSNQNAKGFRTQVVSSVYSFPQQNILFSNCCKITSSYRHRGDYVVQFRFLHNLTFPSPEIFLLYSLMFSSFHRSQVQKSRKTARMNEWKITSDLRKQHKIK